MPCHDGRDDPDFRHNSDVADMLCNLMTQLEEHGRIVEIPYPLQVWWQQHKERDLKRLRRTGWRME